MSTSDTKRIGGSLSINLEKSDGCEIVLTSTEHWLNHTVSSKSLENSNSHRFFSGNTSNGIHRLFHPAHFGDSGTILGGTYVWHYGRTVRPVVPFLHTTSDVSTFKTFQFVAIKSFTTDSSLLQPTVCVCEHHTSHVGAHHVSSSCVCSDSLRLFHFPLFAQHLLSYHLILPPAHQLHLPTCAGQIPCALSPKRTLTPLPKTLSRNVCVTFVVPPRFVSGTRSSRSLCRWPRHLTTRCTELVVPMPSRKLWPTQRQLTITLFWTLPCSLRLPHNGATWCAPSKRNKTTTIHHWNDEIESELSMRLDHSWTG